MKRRMSVSMSVSVVVAAASAFAAVVLAPGCNPCPSVCTEVCAGRPEPVVPPGCPIPSCVCAPQDAGSDAGP